MKIPFEGFNIDNNECASV